MDFLKPIHIPDDGNERVINVSGGRTSGYMLAGILKAHGGELPERTRAIFTNTGKEREATLVFLKKMSEAWNVPITWLEYRYDPLAKGYSNSPKHVYVEVDFDTASRNGEPFMEMTRAVRMLPNVAQRKCTYELKVKTTQRYMRRELGISKYRNMLGMRYDEPGRVMKMLREKDCLSEMPLFHYKVAKKDIIAFWQDNFFDLALPIDESNCDLCFLKGAGQLKRLIQEDPSLADWWIEQEIAVTALREKGLNYVTFNKKFSYRELRDAALNGAKQEELFTETETRYSCFCGD